MSDVATIPPARRPELMLRPIGNRGEFVVKDPQSGQYFNLGPQESFLLERLDGEQTARAICDAFERHFNEPLSEQDLGEFLEVARSMGFLQAVGVPGTLLGEDARAVTTADYASAPPSRAAAEPTPAKPRQSILYWRKSAFDPDRFFNWLEPRIRFVWTRGFVIVSAACMAVALLVVLSNGHEIVSRFPQVARWEPWVLAWLTLVLATTLHEFAHGLTCRHHGGEVHEVGFLLMYFIPCFYCNVSDAWLFREKSKRVWVTLAGAYCDLMLW